MILNIRTCFLPFLVGFFGVSFFSAAAWGAIVSAEELGAARRWAAAVFEEKAEENAFDPGLEVVRNWGNVQKNGRYGKPFRIGDATYVRGLFCHAPTKIIVRLPGPGKSFDAVVGIDNALQWDVRDYQSGPIWPEFTVSVKNGDQEFCTAKLKSGKPASIHADLGGVKQFTLEMIGFKEMSQVNAIRQNEEAQKKAAGKTKIIEVNEWCEADWIDAKAVLEDGQTVFLDELPLPITTAKIEPEALSFSFNYDGVSSASFLPSWKRERSSKELDADRVERTVTYTDPKTGLAVRCTRVEYRGFPIVEWTLYFKNTSSKDTPILENIRPLDIILRRGPDCEFLLHHFLGSSCREDDFRPAETVLGPRAMKSFSPVVGYSSDPYMPYFNVETGSGDGLIIAVGWPVQWAAEFSRDEGDGLSIRAGQEKTHFTLHPGEEIRTPLIVLQFYRGNWIRSQNIWRRWMIAHNLPRPGGKLPEPILSGISDTGNSMSEANQKEQMDRLLDEGMAINWWWMDLGWHPCGKEITSDSTWEGAKVRFPHGLRPLTDYAHSKGLKCIAWHAPETFYLEGHDNFVLKATGVEPLIRDLEMITLDYGNPDALKWLIERIDRSIVSGGLDCYRHDTDWGPLPALRANEPNDRQGIAEIRYAQGYLEFYDELLRRHPNLMIDNCCRGGRRNDLETMRRSVPLWRSDFVFNPTSAQSQTLGLAHWLPYFGTGCIQVDEYAYRSQMCPSYLLCHAVSNRSLDLSPLKKLNEQWREVAPNYYGDYYPLTSYTPESGQWAAWQFDRPEAGKGFVQIFYRGGKSLETMNADVAAFKLQGLNEDATYELKNYDEPIATRVSGSDLSQKGLKLPAGERPVAWLFGYRKTD